MGKFRPPSPAEKPWLRTQELCRAAENLYHEWIMGRIAVEVYKMQGWRLHDEARELGYMLRNYVKDENHICVQGIKIRENHGEI